MYKIKSIYWILCRPISYALVTPWNCVITCVICVFVKRWCKNLQPYKIIHVLNLLIDSSVKKSNKRTLLWIQVVHHIWLVILVYTSISCYMQNSTRLTPGFHSSFTHLYVLFLLLSVGGGWNCKKQSCKTMALAVDGVLLVCLCVGLVSNVDSFCPSKFFSKSVWYKITWIKTCYM